MTKSLIRPRASLSVAFLLIALPSTLSLGCFFHTAPEPTRRVEVEEHREHKEDQRERKEERHERKEEHREDAQ